MPFDYLCGKKIGNFRDIPPGWYKIIFLSKSLYDGVDVHRLSVRDRMGNEFDVWAPSCLFEFLDSEENNIVWRYGFYKE